MLTKVINQASWSMLGSIFGFAVGFFVKMYLIRAVGMDDFGKYVIGQTIVSTVTVFIALAVPQILLRYLPALLAKGKQEQADHLASFGLQYSLGIGALSTVVVMVLHYQIAGIFAEADQTLREIVFYSALYIPLTLYMSSLYAAYRSLLKIREIVFYGTFVIISVRALLTFVVFSFTDDIRYFVWIEVVTLMLVAIIMTLKFDHSKLSLFVPFPIRQVLDHIETVRFGKKMYFYALVGFGEGYAIILIMSTSLPAADIGVYTILTTIAGLSAFLLTNLNSVFAPLISKLSAVGEMGKLEHLFKDTTFIVNIITVPFIVLLMIFAQDILALYGDNVSSFVTPLAVLVFGSYINLFVGNSGMLLLMGGRENDEIYIKIGNVILMLGLSFWLIPRFGLEAAVWLNTASLILINLLHVFFVKKRYGFTPWTVSSLWLFVLTLGMIGATGYYKPDYIGQASDYLLYTGIVLTVYWLPFYKKIISVVQMIKHERQ